MSLTSVWNTAFGRPRPEQIVCVGLNYHDHAVESKMEVPAAPLLFSKLPSTVIGPNDFVEIPPEAQHVDGEAELAVVIGRTARAVARADALDVVAGYTVANDVSARDVQFSDGQWFRGKSFDTFCPLLPTIVPTSELGDGSGLRVVQRLNGETLQDSSTDDFIFDVPAIVEYVTRVVTLGPGDLILTGTPAGVGIFRDPKVALQPGDEVEIEIDGIGVLRSPVRARAAV